MQLPSEVVALNVMVPCFQIYGSVPDNAVHRVQTAAVLFNLQCFHFQNDKAVFRISWILCRSYVLLFLFLLPGKQNILWFAANCLIAISKVH